MPGACISVVWSAQIARGAMAFHMSSIAVASSCVLERLLSGAKPALPLTVYLVTCVCTVLRTLSCRLATLLGDILGICSAALPCRMVCRPCPLSQ